jgi:hypothetical protein
MQLNGDYLSRIPKAVPAGKILVHNDICPPSAASAQRDFAFGLRPHRTASKSAHADGHRSCPSIIALYAPRPPVWLRWLPSVIIAFTWNIPRP